MKKVLLLFVLITAFIGAKAQDGERKQLPPDLDMLRTFYSFYVLPYVDGSQSNERYRKQSLVRRTYCTKRAQDRYLQLMQQATTEDDAFIKASEVTTDDIKSMEYIKVPNQPGRYKVTYQGLEKITIELALIKDKDKWLIDYIY